MLISLRRRAWTRVSVLFPERQIYIRSDGRVQFFTFSSQMQAALAGVLLTFLGWVAFTSVNVIFKDRILAAKELRFAQMQTTYESRIADLQLSYDELNGALILAQDRFKTIANSFEAKQQAIAAVIEHKKSLQASLGIGATPKTAQVLKPKLGTTPSAYGVGGVFDAINSRSDAEFAPPFAAEAGLIAPISSTAKTPYFLRRDTAHPANSLQAPDAKHAAESPTLFKGAIQKLGLLFRHQVSASGLDHPIVKQADAQSARIVRLELGESALLGETVQDVEKETSRLTRALRTTGIDTKTLMKRVSATHTAGGPLIPIDPSDGAEDEGFTTTIVQAATAMEKLDDVVTALNAIPLAAPTEVGGISSGFGARIDPFNEQLAFHSGIDFSGPKGSDVQVTAPGIVVFAGPRGAYGNTVEVDHGFGVRTRYGHLSKILVPVGTELDKGATVGRLGSTGRSTGPHVHYEVWYDNEARDPGRFIKAGQDVLKE